MSLNLPTRLNRPMNLTKVRTTIVAGNINSVQGLNEDAVKQMSDEEFAAFMQKAQAFYDNASSAQSSTNETQSSTATVQPSNEVSESDDIPSITKSYTSAESSYAQDEPEEDKYSSYSFGNEMTDEEYIAYLNRSARASRKEESKSATVQTTSEKPATAPEKPKRKSFMPEDDEGGMTDEEYQAYLAEHGDDDEDEEGPVVYGAGKD